mmetsp:Transcript_83295/g.231145  ORF Transcript_83295/g.231145 Transcript_83295/m.231145 type:complete len:213 (+) Transcript_83295:184-822(+)
MSPVSTSATSMQRRPERGWLQQSRRPTTPDRSAIWPSPQGALSPSPKSGSAKVAKSLLSKGLQTLARCNSMTLGTSRRKWSASREGCPSGSDFPRPELSSSVFTPMVLLHRVAATPDTKAADALAGTCASLPNGKVSLSDLRRASSHAPSVQEPFIASIIAAVTLVTTCGTAPDQPESVMFASASGQALSRLRPPSSRFSRARWKCDTALMT